MKELLKLKHLSWIFLFLLLLGWSCASQALPFSVSLTAGTSLPTFAVSGYPMSAYFTVTNTTGKNTSNNYIKYLPPNASIVPGTNTCGATFNLAPQQSCTLHLAISGLVNGNDPDPRHHLFVCEQGGVTCAGVTSGPALNITKSLTAIQIVPNPAIIPLGMTQAFTAIGLFPPGSSSQNINSLVTWTSSNPAVATINASGIATSTGLGTTTITATVGGITSSVTLTVSAAVLESISLLAANSPTANLPIAGMVQFSAIGTYSDGTARDLTSSVTWQTSASSLLTISASGQATGIAAGTAFITAQSGSVVSPPFLVTVRSQYAFVANHDQSNPFVYSCPILGVGSFGACAPNANSLFTTPLQVAFNPSGSHAYVVDSTANFIGGTIYYCLLNSSDYTLTNCTATETGTFEDPINIAFNHTGTYAYVSDLGLDTTVAPGKVYVCAVNTNGSLEACNPTGSLFDTPHGVTVNAAGTFAYITNVEDNSSLPSQSVTTCAINQTDGTLINCQVTPPNTFDVPWNVAVNTANTYAYVGNNYFSTISYCQISGGTLVNCIKTTALAGIRVLSGIAIDSSNTNVYYTLDSANPNGNISYCPIQSDGSLNAATCQVVSGAVNIFTHPQGVTLY